MLITLHEDEEFYLKVGEGGRKNQISIPVSPPHPPQRVMVCHHLNVVC